MKTYEFATARGAKIELTAGDAHHKNEIDLDGQKTGSFEESTSLVVKSLKINGTEYQHATIKKEVSNGSQTVENVVTAHSDNKFIVVQIPTEMFNEIYAGQAGRDAEWLADIKKDVAEDEADQSKLQKHIEAGYCTKCHTYCNGDCTSN